MAFDANINLTVTSTQAERAIKKLERSTRKIEDASRDILAIDKKIVTERRKQLGLEGQQLKNQKARVADLRLQRTELALQKRELQQISTLERRRAKSLATPTSSGDGGGGISSVLPGIAAGASASTQVSRATAKLTEAITTVADKTKSATRESAKFAASQKEVADAAREVGRINGQIEADYFKINDLTNRLNAQLREISRIDGLRRRITKGETEARAKAVVDAKELFNQLNRTVKAQDKLAAGAERYQRSLKGLTTARFQAPGIPAPATAGGTSVAKASQANGLAIGALARQLGILGATYLSVDTAIRQFTTSINKSTESAASVQRIRALADGFDNYNEVLNLAAEAADRFNIGTIQSQNAVAQLFGRLRPLGLSLEEISTVYNGFNTAAALTGATAAESAGALLQLTQALGAGALRGEEFNSVAEQAPAVLQAIAKEVDAPVGQLKELAKQGKLTTDVLIRALGRIEREGAAPLAAALDTPAQKIKTLQNRIEDLQIVFGNLALPGITSAVEDLTGAVEGLTNEVKTNQRAFEKIERFFGDLFNPALVRAVGGVEGLSQAITNLGLNAIAQLPQLAPFIQALQTIARLRDLIAGQPINDTAYTGMQDASGDPIKPNVPTLLQGINAGISAEDGLGTNSSGSRIDGESIGRAFGQDLADRLEAIRLQDQLLERLDAQLAIEKERDPLRKIFLQTTLQLLEVEQDIANRKIGAGTTLQQQLDRELKIRQDILAIQAEQARQEVKRDQVLKGIQAGIEADEQLDKVTDLEKAVESASLRMGRALEDALVSTIEAAVTGAKDLGETLQSIAADLLGDVGRMFIKAGINGLGGALNLPGFAEGGRPEINTVSIVGERGPELFVPDTAGTILSNEQSRAAMARYSPSNATANAAISGNDAGTIGAAGGSGVVQTSFKLETTVINGVEYATVDQVRAMGLQATKAGAIQGEASTLKRLRMSPSARRKVGL